MAEGIGRKLARRLRLANELFSVACNFRNVACEDWPRKMEKALAAYEKDQRINCFDEDDLAFQLEHTLRGWDVDELTHLRETRRLAEPWFAQAKESVEAAIDADDESERGIQLHMAAARLWQGLCALRGVDPETGDLKAVERVSATKHPAKRKRPS